MNRNKFGKISFEQYKEDCIRELITEDELLKEWETVQLPQRSTLYSAGYDFKAPFDFILRPDDVILIPTGIRCELEHDKFLQIVPRSGLGFKYSIHLENTIGVADSDYQSAKNEGHLMLKMSNRSLDKTRILSIKKGDGIAQGIILEYFLTEDDDLYYKKERIGGFGSTGGING